MEIRYNVTGAKRKELVKVISDTTGARAEYKFMPTCNYEIDYFTVTKDGTLLFDDRAYSDEVEKVLEAIAAADFECEAQDGEEQAVPYADWSAEKQAEYKLQAADLTTQGSAADTVSADMTQVDALSGATITSTAVTDIVNNSYFYVTEVLCAE